MARQRRWHIFVFSFLFSSLLWISVNLGSKYQTFIEVRLDPINFPKNKALLEPLPQKVNVKFNGLGWQIASLYFNPNVKYELDFSNFKNNRYISLKQNLNDNIKIPSRLETIDISPESLEVEFDDYLEKRIPVIPQVEVKCMEGYGVVGEIKVNPDTITIGGASSIVKKLVSWPTEHQTFNEVRDDIAAILPLYDTLRQIFKISHRMVGININVQMIAEQKFKEINIDVTGIPPQTIINIIPPKFDVVIRSGIDVLTGLDRNQIKAKISYKEIFEDTTGYITPKIELPVELKIIQIIPNKFEYVIRKSDK